MTPASEVLLDATLHDDAGSWLLLGGGSELALGLAGEHPDAAIHWQPIDLRERLTLAHPPANVLLEEPGAANVGIGAGVIPALPDRDLARRWLLTVRQALAANGRLFLAGANAEGIRSVIADAGKLFGPPIREEYRARQRVAAFAVNAMPPHLPDWAATPGVEPGTWQPFDLVPPYATAPLVTQAGVFAGDRIDAGTRMLLDALPERIEGRVLDVGCGAGVIGIAAALLGAEAVDMTDVNLLAVQAAAENIRRLELSHLRVVASDIYSAVGDERYDLIVSNPPFHRGKAVDYTVADRLIHEAPQHLAPGGSLLIVANAYLAYGKRMARIFRRVESIAATRRYHVLRASDPD